MEKVKTCIIIPAYNEEKRIGKTLANYISFFQEIKQKGKIDFEILVVINNTRDNTEGVVKEHQKKAKELKFLNFKQGGKGFAITEGFKYAIGKGFDLIGFVDADCSTPARVFYDMIINLDGNDGVIAGRWNKKSLIPIKQTISRQAISRIFNFMVRSLFVFNFRDTQCGAKVFRREAIEKVFKELKVSEWAFDVNLLYSLKRNKIRVREIPTYWIDKEGSKVQSLSTSIGMFLAILRLRIVYSPMERLSKPLKPIVRIIYKMIK